MVNQIMLKKYLKNIANHKKNTGKATNSIKFENPETFAAFLEITIMEMYATYGDPPYSIDVVEYDAETEN